MSELSLMLDPPDELHLIQTTQAKLSAREAELRQILIQDRELRIGATHHAIVTKVGDHEEVDIEPLPDLRQIYDLLLLGPVVVVDTETTGVHPYSGDRLVSAAILPVTVTAEPRGYTVHAYPEKAVHLIVDPGRLSSPEALAIHGLTKQHLASHAPFSAIGDTLAQATAGVVCVAHGATFDVGFLEMEFRRLGRAFSEELKAVVDTRLLCKLLWPDERGSLDALAQRLRIDRGSRDEGHDAMEDATLLARCLPGLLSALREAIEEDAIAGGDVREGAHTGLAESHVADLSKGQPRAPLRLVQTLDGDGAKHG